VLCQYNISRDNLSEGCRITPGKTAPTITALEAPNWVAVSSMVHKKDIANVMDELQAKGATDILTLDIANTRVG
jgi:ATP phosphoribosyltransferase